MPGFEKVKTRKTQKYKKDTNSKSGKCKKYNKVNNYTGSFFYPLSGRYHELKAKASKLN